MEREKFQSDIQDAERRIQSLMQSTSEGSAAALAEAMAAQEKRERELKQYYEKLMVVRQQEVEARRATSGVQTEPMAPVERVVEKLVERIVEVDRGGPTYHGSSRSGGGFPGVIPNISVEGKVMGDRARTPRPLEMLVDAETRGVRWLKVIELPLGVLLLVLISHH